MFTNNNPSFMLTAHLTATNASGKYDAVFIIDADDGKTLAKEIIKAINAAMMAGNFPANTQPTDIRLPFRNTTTFESLYTSGGSVYGNSWSAPAVYDAAGNALNANQINSIMPGTAVAFAVEIVPYAVDTNIGIRLELNEIMLLPPGTAGTPAYLSAQKQTFTLDDFMSASHVVPEAMKP